MITFTFTAVDVVTPDILAKVWDGFDFHMDEDTLSTCEVLCICYIIFSHMF